MEISAALVDLSGNARAFLDGYTKLTITPRLNNYAQVGMELPRGLSLGAELEVGKRAVRVYDSEELLFFGKLWEPLSFSSDGHSFEARDSLAEFLSRRVREKVVYTDQDAAAIVYARLAAQNAKRNTYLREGDGDVSVNRTRTVLPGALERDLIEEMANAADGYFFRAVPVDGVFGVMADLDIIYPDAGATLPEVLFAFGEGTVDTLADYEVVHYLPKNRQVASSSASTGGRIAKAAEDVDSIEAYGLFEDEVAFSDVSQEALLEQHAEASVKAAPPRTVAATPSANAPMLFDDFRVGDFVRVQIKDDGLDILEWARVTEATLEITSEGNPRLTNIVFEFLVGDTITTAPHQLFRAQLDDTRRRLEALERRQQIVTQTATSSPSEPAAGGGSGGGSPSDPGGAPAPPPATPGDPPFISALAAVGVNYRSGGILYRGVEVTVSVDFKGLNGVVSVNVAGSLGTMGGSGTVFIEKGPGTHSVDVVARTSAGDASASTSANVPAFTAE